MRRRSIDEALSDFKLQGELNRTKNEVQLAEEKARSFPAYLPPSRKNMQPAPHVVLRTALFTALADRDKKNGSRDFVRNMQVKGLANMRVTFTGQVLDQQDLDVFLAVLHSAQGKPLDDPLVTTTRRLLLVQKKTDDGRSYADLEESLKRLAGAVLDVEQGGARFIGSLLVSATRIKASEGWTVRIDPKLVELFEPGGFALINLDVRSALRGKPLAKWLDAYFTSQPNPYPLKLETVRALCGSKSKDLRSFRQTLVKALNWVAKARMDHGVVFSWTIDSTGLLRVAR